MENKFVKIQRTSNLPIREDMVYEVTEKVDGANFSFYVGDIGELVFRSRNRELVEGDGKGWSRCVLYLSEVHTNHPFEEGYIYFGECMTKHTIHYGETHAFIGFAVLDVCSDKYIERWSKHYMLRDIPHVDWLYVSGTDINTYVDNHLNDKSAYGDTNAIQEGLVFKCYETQEFVKFVRDQFKEDNRKVFGGKLVPEDDTGKIVLRFCTHARIEKHVYRIRDEKDMPIGLEMMQHLPKDVCDDIICEEFMTIYGKYTTMNFKQFRKLVAHECVQYFKSHEMVV